ESRLGCIKTDLSEADVGLYASTEDRNVHVDAEVEIVALKAIEKILVVVELSEHAINADQLHRGKVAALFTSQAELLGADVGLSHLQSCISLHRHGDKVGTLLLGFAGQILGRHFDGLVLGEPKLAAQENLQFVLASFEVDGALGDASLGQLSLGDFDRQLEAFGLAFLSDLQNPRGTVLLLGKKLE